VNRVDALRGLLGVVISLPLTLGALGQEPATVQPALNQDAFRHVAQVVWVVKDLDRVVAYWEHLGVRDIHRDGVVHYKNLTYRGKADPAHWESRDQVDSAGARRPVLAGWAARARRRNPRAELRGGVGERF